MARLTVEAMLGWRDDLVAEGSHDEARLIVSVTDEGGKPVDGLKKRHFKVSHIDDSYSGEEATTQVAPDVTSVSAGATIVHQHGFYVVSIKPGSTAGWHRIVLGVAVERKRLRLQRGPRRPGPQPEPDRGQTLVGLDVASA